MSKLWDKSAKLNLAVEAYTVGNDYLLDMKLLPFDLQASLAHAKMLASKNLIDEAEYKNIEKALAEIKDLYESGEFSIKPEQEDGHTAIEQYITQKYGEAGKKIHTGRSRNDQVLTALRLYMKDVLPKLIEGLQQLSKIYTQKSETAKNIPMPGYTHMQKAMPSSVSDWLSGYGEAFGDLVPLVKATAEVIDQSPLGSAAGFGVKGLEVDREMTASELGLSDIQSPIYAGLSRGYFELMVLQNCELVMTLCAKFANDMLLFTTQEFGYFSLPGEFTTGSSIMPNKRNYDLFEIMRGNAKTLAAYSLQVQSTVAGIGSGFQRDLQLTKEPFLKGTELALKTLELLSRVIQEIHIDEEKLKNAMSDDLYATEKAYKLVKQGVPFREAYMKVKDELFKEEK